MRNIPVFTTEFGVASLVLKEIPYTQTAYIKLQSSLEPELLLSECISFCRAAGAERIYAAGDRCLQKYPLHTKVLRMQADKSELPDTCAIAKPVLPEELQRWKDCYNRSMEGVANAAYMDDMDAKDMLRKEEGYFIIRNDVQIGIGRVSGECILVVASMIRGSGRDTTLALLPFVSSNVVCLEVASTNHRAIRLYESLGFQCQAEVSAWYKIL